MQRMTRFSLATLTAALAAGVAAGQPAPFIDGVEAPEATRFIGADGQPMGTGSRRPISADRNDIFGPGSRIELPPVAAEFFLMEDLMNDTGQTRLRTGVVQDVMVEAAADGTWTRLDDGRWVWAIEFTSPGSTGLRLRVADWSPPAGTELYVWEPGDLATVQRPIDTARERVDTAVWTPTIWADSIRVEMVLPAGLQEVPENALIRIDQVVNCYNGPDGPTTPVGGPGPGTALSCHLDWNCYADYAVTGRSIALYHFVGDGFSFICSGFLLNRDNTDLTPVFGTAWHCGVRDDNVESLEVYWRYETTSCDGTVPNVNTLNRSNGVVALVTDNDHDWSLIGLDGQFANWYLGWNAGVLADNSPTVVIHHPRGTFKKITFAQRTDVVQSCIGGTIDDGAYFNNIDDGDGEIEPGSSGSPLLDEFNRVRGTTSCASWGCNQNNAVTHGRFDLAFPDLSPFLQPAFEVWVDDSYGGTERGTVSQPFDKFFDGIFAVQEGGIVNLDAGTYRGVTTITKAMTIRSTGGTVVLGQ